MPTARVPGRTRWLACPGSAVAAALAWQAIAGGAPAPAPAEIELVYLANEGFLVRRGERVALIDAFVDQPYSIYAAVPAAMRADLLAGAAPFDGVDLALASHAHPDHFQADSAAGYLRARAEVAFVSSPQVSEAVLAALGEGDAARARVRSLLPEAGKTAGARAAEISIELLRLPHAGGERNAAVQNLGHVLDLGGARVLHLGDADAGAGELAAYDFPALAVDVALVPYWWFGDEPGRALVRDRIQAAHVVACHVPPRELAGVRDLLAEHAPGVLLFERAGESKRLAIARPAK